MNTQYAHLASPYSYSPHDPIWHIIKAHQLFHPDNQAKLEQAFPEIFQDNEVKWRNCEEMQKVVEGFYWLKNEVVSVYHTNNNTYYNLFGEAYKIDESPSSRFYGPLPRPEPEPE